SKIFLLLDVMTKRDFKNTLQKIHRVSSPWAAGRRAPIEGVETDKMSAIHPVSDPFLFARSMSETGWGAGKTVWAPPSGRRRAVRSDNAARHLPLGVKRGRHDQLAVGEYQIVGVVAPRSAFHEGHRLQLPPPAEHGLCHGQVPADDF